MRTLFVIGRTLLFIFIIALVILFIQLNKTPIILDFLVWKSPQLEHGVWLLTSFILGGIIGYFSNVLSVVNFFNRKLKTKKGS